MDASYFEILRCPHCAPTGGGELSMVKQDWLRCADCTAQYPVVDDIPVMLPEEGVRYRGIAVDELPTIKTHQRHGG